MKSNEIGYFFILMSIVLLGHFTSWTIYTEMGELTVTKVQIINHNDGSTICGTLYKPKMTNNISLPGVLCIHGLSSSKQSMSAIAFEVSRRGFIVLSIDMTGHGESTGFFPSRDLTNGARSALDYLRKVDGVNSSLIGVIGHSLGAYTASLVSNLDGNINATVLIGGGLTNYTSSQVPIDLSSIKNLLIAIGRYDSLIDLTDVKEILDPVFETNDTRPFTLYGSFTDGSAKKLIITQTNHLFEPVDSRTIIETCLWMKNSLKLGIEDEYWISEHNQIFHLGEISMLVSIVSMLLAIVPLSIFLIDQFNANKTKITAGKQIKSQVSIIRSLIVIGIVHIVLFLPAALIGIAFPLVPQVFGSSILIWLSLIAIAELFLIIIHIKIKEGNTTSIKHFLKGIVTNWRNEIFYNHREIVLGIIGFFILFYLENLLLSTTTGLTLHFLVPIFPIINLPSKLLIFIIYLLPTAFYFYIDGLYLHEFTKMPSKSIDKPWINYLQQYGLPLAIKITPLLAVLLVQYIPLVVINYRLFSGSIALLMILFFMVIPFFLICTLISSFFYNLTKSVVVGSIFNTILVSWVLTGLLPIGVLAF